MRKPARTSEHQGSTRTVRVRWAFLPVALLAVMLSGCVPLQPAVPTLPAAPAPAAASGRLAIYAPATTSTVPVVLAARRLQAVADAEAADLTIFSNHSQANTLFLRGDVQILVTGLSVGLQFFRNGAPVQAIDCNVSGLTYLVTSGRQVGSFAQLKGEELYLPFEGSPIEEISQFFAEREGLVWKQDIKPVYAPFDSSLALLKQGKAAAVALPEPYVSLAEQQAQVYVSIPYRAKWDALTGSNRGYPQVCAFAMKSWVAAHPQAVSRFNRELAQAVEEVARDPAVAAQQTGTALGLAQEILAASLRRTDFAFYRSDEMAQEVRRYYQTIGKPLDASYDPFFYRDLEGSSK